MLYTLQFYFPEICSYKGGKYKAIRGVSMKEYKEYASKVVDDKDGNYIMYVYKGKYASWDDEFEHQYPITKMNRCTEIFYDTHYNELTQIERKFCCKK